MTNSDFLRDLAERLMHVPVMHGTDQGDVSRLHEIANRLDAIRELSKPGQTVTVDKAVDIICDIWMNAND